MVYYKPDSKRDLDNILYGLLLCPKHPLEPKYAMQYVRDIREICDSLDLKSYHEKSSYSFHKKYGEYVCRYKRNRNTCWYIIYGRDSVNDVFIERIINNYMTAIE
jgi:hypothetical protein